MHCFIYGSICGFLFLEDKGREHGDVWRWMSPWCSVVWLGLGEEVCCQHKQELGTGLGLDGIQVSQLISYTQVVGSRSLPLPRNFVQYC